MRFVVTVGKVVLTGWRHYLFIIIQVVVVIVSSEF